MADGPERLSRAEVLRIAGLAIVDPRTVENFIRGGEMKKLTKLRIQRAIAELYANGARS